LFLGSLVNELQFPIKVEVSNCKVVYMELIDLVIEYTKHLEFEEFINYLKKVYAPPEEVK
jgi:hypothetical protein